MHNGTTILNLANQVERGIYGGEIFDPFVDFLPCWHPSKLSISELVAFEVPLPEEELTPCEYESSEGDCTQDAVVYEFLTERDYCLMHFNRVVRENGEY